MKIASYDVLTNKETPIGENKWIKFGEGHDRITVSVRDGTIEVSCDGRLSVEPRAANLVRIRTV